MKVPSVFQKKKKQFLVQHNCSQSTGGELHQYQQDALETPRASNLTSKCTANDD